MEGVVIDTNVFVAAGFNARSASARILAPIREWRFHLVWNEPTRREAEFVLRGIPLLGCTCPAQFNLVASAAKVDRQSRLQ